MEDLSLLNKKCLANMPMLLDTLTTTMEELRVLFSLIYDSMREFVEENSFSCTNKRKIENLSLFTDIPKKPVNLLPYAGITYELNMERKVKRSSLEFEMDFGYLCDDGQVYQKQNAIYFQLFDHSEKLFLENDLLETLKQNAPSVWRTDFSENNIWMEFDVDDIVSIDKINQCAEDFKQYILQPVFNKLNG